jgi:flagellar hook-length control protein FliK
MAHVPVMVATVEPKNTQSMKSMVGKKTVRRNIVREERNRDGKSFSEMMDKAGKGTSSEEKTAKKSGISKGRKSFGIVRSKSNPFAGTRFLIDKNQSPKSPALTDLDSENLSDEPADTNLQFPLAVDDTPGSRKQMALAVSSASDIAVPALKRRNSDNRNRNTEMTKAGKIGKIGKSGSGNLSSTAPRIEVVDKRPGLGISEVRESGISETTGKSNFRNASGRKTSRTESSGNRIEGTGPVKSETGFAVAETDIEISSRGDGKSIERSAAAELGRKLDAQAGNDIVRQVKVVLNRANTGEVRINLRPDNLGRVSIRINLEDNRLTGRIFVESAAAKEAFRNALDGLQTRLVESGFGAADLELAWDDSGKEFAQNGQQSGKKSDSMNEVMSEIENIVPTTAFDEIADGRVNMVV